MNSGEPRHSTPIPNNEEHSLVTLPSDLEDTRSQKSVDDPTEHDESKEFDETYTGFESTSPSATRTSSESSSKDVEDEMTAWHLWLLKKERDRRKNVPEVGRKVHKGEVDDLKKKLGTLEEWVHRKDRERKTKKSLEEEKVTGERHREQERQKERYERADQNFHVWMRRKIAEAEVKKKAEAAEEERRQENLRAQRERNQTAYEKWLLFKKTNRQYLVKGSTKRIHKTASVQRQDTVVRIVPKRGDIINFEVLGHLGSSSRKNTKINLKV